MSVTATAAEDFSEEAFLAGVAQLCAEEPTLSQVGAAILLALHLGICADSRTFARLFGIEHALVLRGVTELADGVFVTVTGRNARTQRTGLALTEGARSLLASSAATKGRSMRSTKTLPGV
jgi:hypothetical protein